MLKRHAWLWFAFAIVTGCSPTPRSSRTRNEQAPPSSATVEVPSGSKSKAGTGHMDGVLRRTERQVAAIGRVTRIAYAAYAEKTNNVNAPDESPRFVLADGQPGAVEHFPLERTHVDVHIAGVIAQVRVLQTYVNRGRTPIEATYVFPACTRAAVSGMKMTIGKRIIEAKIRRRSEAAAAYEHARALGIRASLLDQYRPNIFTMHVANIRPGDRIKVELDYQELMVPVAGLYSFMYPAVVGPRYGRDSSRDHHEDSVPKAPSRTKTPSYRFGVTLHMESPIGIQELTSPSHSINVHFASKTSAAVTLPDGLEGNRDFVLRYRLASDRIDSGVLLYEGTAKKDGRPERFFMAMIEPPQAPVPDRIPSREYVFILDVSGSMKGFPLDTAKRVIQQLFATLKPTDWFNLVLFAGSARVLSPKSLPATKTNLQRILALTNQQEGGGSTELMGALRHAYALPSPSSLPLSRTIVVMTDGLVTIEADAFRFVRRNLGRANLFAFGIGTSVNRWLIESLARAGMGVPFIVLDAKDADAAAKRFVSYIARPVLTNIEVTTKGMGTYDVLPKSLPDLLQERPILVVGKYRGRGTARITVAGQTQKGPYKKTITISAKSARPSNRPIRFLWAKKWIEILTDQLTLLPNNAEIRDAITTLGLNYHLLTAFTSFVAVDREQATALGRIILPVAEPLPLVHVPARRLRAPGSTASHPPSKRAADNHAAQFGGQPMAMASPDSGTKRTPKTGSDGLVVSVSLMQNVASNKVRIYRKRIVQRLKSSVCLRRSMSESSKFLVTVVLRPNGSISISGGTVPLRLCMTYLFRTIIRRLKRNGDTIDRRAPIRFVLSIAKPRPITFESNPSRPNRTSRHRTIPSTPNRAWRNRS